ncbi:hypothetical protein CVS40_8025 [Lucilia cuprina]|nr:hypothetical protein CVS40_8025 [Lucilia cuprina]KAI8120771.1 hypothetical protein CVS40_8025 [Lucilia cuprina]KAI8120772.1 hypothetical protein CVS40_8025 [Lucilia cuprina]
MLVATPGQTTAYSTIHNNTNNNNNSSSNGGGVVNNTVAAATTTKKTSSLNSTNTTVSSTPKSLNNNNNHTAAVVANKNSLNSNTQPSYHNHTNPKHDSIVSHKLQQQNKMTATSSREAISSNLTAAATTHSLKNENSTNNTNTTNNNTTNIITSNSASKQQSFIQTLKDSVQKALISTTGTSGSSHNSIVTKLSTDNKLPTNSNNLTTSIHNVTSSSAATTHNAAKVSTTTTSTNSSNSTAATQSLSSSSSSSVSLVRSKYFSCSLSKLHTVAPTIIHRYPEERQHASSTDSLQKEMCHFKPIRIVPTTPWKSKSRGNSLRFPKANLATKKTEFVLKSNCDVNNRKKKQQQQQNRTQTDKINLDKDDDNEQENKEFHGIYKPKPSLTCLSTSVTTPNHQSAFVCLVAQMKSLVNLQSKKQQTPAAVEEGSNEPIKELYVRKKPANRKSLPAREIVSSPKDLAKSRTTRLTLNKRVANITTNNKTTTQNTSKENVKRTNAKSNNNSISKSSTASITKAKSRRKLGSAKSKTINLVNLASTRGKGKLQNSVSMPAVVSNVATATATVNKRSRKRKLTAEEDEIALPTKITSSKSLALGARKSTRLSKDMTSNSTTKSIKSPITTTNLKTSHQRTRKNPTAAVVCFSPPLTRSRLKHLAEQGKIITTNTATTEVKKRKN